MLSLKVFLGINLELDLNVHVNRFKMEWHSICLPIPEN